MKYKVFIKTKNKMFMIKGKQIRTPFHTIMDENELKRLKSKINSCGILLSELIIQPIIEDNLDTYTHVKSNIVTTQKIEEPKTDVPIIDKLVVKPQEVLIPEKPKKVQEQEEKPKIIEKVKNIPKVQKPTHLVNKIYKPQIPLEQNKKEYDSSGVEIKIEELSIKSSSILDKFLNGSFE